MNVSESRQIANRQNALKSTGPKTIAGKKRSRQNSLKHGLTGLGVVSGPLDAAEIERRENAFRDELAPRTTLGAILIRQLATLSVRMERGSRHELAMIASRVRHAEDAFDQERRDVASAWLDAIAKSPAHAREQLVRMPEGVALLVDGLRGLGAELALQNSRWSKPYFERMLSLMGQNLDQSHGTRLAMVAAAAWGFLGDLPEAERGAMDPNARKAWARRELIERIETEIATLEAHLATIDRDRIALDRAEAVERALFDGSPETKLAQRYEAEARRAFFKALKEFRIAEADSPDPALAPKMDPANEEVASSRRNLDALEPTDEKTGQFEPARAKSARPDPSKTARNRKNRRARARHVVV